MYLKRHQAALLFALLLLCGCAVRRSQTEDDWFKNNFGNFSSSSTPAQSGEMVGWRWVWNPEKGWVLQGPVGGPAQETPVPQQTRPTHPPEPPVLVAETPTPEPKPAAPRPKPKRKPKPRQAVKRQKGRRVPPAPVVVAGAPGDPGEKENSGGFPPLLYGLMPFGAAALWMAGRAAARAARKG